MSSYSKTTNFTAKDTLPTGNPSKIIRGSEIDTEYSAIQTAVNSKADSISPSFSGTVTLAGSTAISTNSVSISDVELGYLDGVTSNIQNQISLKAPIASPTFTGVPTAPTATAGTGTTQIATTAFVAATAFSSALPAQTGNAGKFVTTDGANASWAATLPPSIIRSARTANTILAAADNNTLIDITSGTFTQTFTAAATLGSGWFCYIRNAGTGDITLDPDASELIDGLTSFIMYPGEVRLVQCDGTELKSIVLTPFSKVFTATGNFIKPPGYLNFGGIIWSAGCSGQRTNSLTTLSVGGAGGGAFPFTFQSLQLGASETMTIGAGGLAVTTVAGGNVGGNSAFGSLLTIFGSASAISGGAFGATVAKTESVPNGFQGAGSTATPSISVWGGAAPSNNASAISGVSVYGGAAGGGVDAAGVLRAAGTSNIGGNGGAAATNTNGTDGTAPGGGGGATQTGTQSGAGARGEIRIWGIL